MTEAQRIVKLVCSHESSVPGSVPDVCVTCGHQVSVSPSSVIILARERIDGAHVDIVCLGCAMLAAARDGEGLNVFPPDENQRVEIDAELSAAFVRREKNECGH